MFPALSDGVRRIAFLSFSVTFFLTPFALNISGQGSATNDLGNGGRHSIQGRIFLASGKRSSLSGLKIRLVNFSYGDITVVADTSGTFLFKNLNPGNYVVTVEGGDLFENFQESVSIDDPGTSSMGGTLRVRGGSKIVNVQVYLREKVTHSPSERPGVLNATLASIPKAAVRLYQQAQQSIADKNELKAITQLRDAIALHKEFSLAWNDLGVLLQKLGDPSAALDAFRSAVTHDPLSAAANLNFGCALYNAKRYQEAERYLTTAIVRNETSYRGHYYMGLTQLKLGREDIAEQAFKKAIDVGDEQSGMAHYMLGGIYWSVKRYKEAADELEQYLKLEPNAKDVVKTRESIAELRGRQN